MQMQPAVGQTWGDYTLLKLLGKGSFGSVFSCVNNRNRIIYAVKFVDVTNMPPVNLAYLKQEIQILQMLKHPNIIQLIEHGKISNYHLIVTEFVGGGALSDFIAKNGPVKEEQMQIWTIQLVEAMCYLRDRRISHRDLKPANILLTTDANPVLKLCDFGFARMYTEYGMRSELGSPLYEAPEIRSGCYGPSVDLWSMGLVLLEMLLGAPAIKATTFEELHKFLDDPHDLQLPQQIKCSPACADLLTSLLKKNPDHRIPWEKLKTHEFVKLPTVTFICGCKTPELPPAAYTTHMIPLTLQQYQTVGELCNQFEQMGVGLKAAEQLVVLCSTPPVCLQNTDKLTDHFAAIRRFGLFVYNRNLVDCAYPTTLAIPTTSVPAIVPFITGVGHCTFDELQRISIDHNNKLQIVEELGAKCNTNFQIASSFFEPITSLYEGIKCLCELAKFRIEDIKKPEQKIALESSTNIATFRQKILAVSEQMKKAQSIQLPKELASDKCQTAFQLMQQVIKNFDPKTFPPTPAHSKEITRVQEELKNFNTNINPFHKFFNDCSQSVIGLHKTIDEVNKAVGSARAGQHKIVDEVNKANCKMPFSPDTIRSAIKETDAWLPVLVRHDTTLRDGAIIIYQHCVTMWKKFYSLCKLINDIINYPSFLEKITTMQNQMLEVLEQNHTMNESILNYITLTSTVYMNHVLMQMAEQFVDLANQRQQSIKSSAATLSALLGRTIAPQQTQTFTTAAVFNVFSNVIGQQSDTVTDIANQIGDLTINDLAKP